MGKQMRQCYESLVKMIWFHFRYVLVELFLFSMNHLKLYLLMKVTRDRRFN